MIHQLPQGLACNAGYPLCTNPFKLGHRPRQLLMRHHRFQQALVLLQSQQTTTEQALDLVLPLWQLGSGLHESGRPAGLVARQPTIGVENP
ncbi:hypothetical protein ACQKEF_12460 [Pseudomonas oryzihabitans]|uniref:hypothetical protein n=1 Tax=Pseudomonas oryzihabitans TaxID=47885 RepID=UPI003D01DA86